ETGTGNLGQDGMVSHPATPSAPKGRRYSVLRRGLARDAGDIELQPRPHRGRQADALDEGAFDAGRPRAADRADEGLDVLDQGVLGEARLADAGLDDAGLLGA